MIKRGPCGGRRLARPADQDRCWQLGRLGSTSSMTSRSPRGGMAPVASLIELLMGSHCSIKSGFQPRPVTR
jgi:hypothetical protein